MSCGEGGATLLCGPLPSTLPTMHPGSLLKVALTSYKALVWYAGAKNDTLWQRKPAVLILGGSGGCGTVAIQLAKAFGAGTITTTTSARNFQYCTDLGSTRNIDYKAQDWWAPSVIPDESMDVIYDTVRPPPPSPRRPSPVWCASVDPMYPPPPCANTGLSKHGPRVSALLVLFLNRRFCGSDPIENVVYSFVQDAGRVNMGDKVLLQL